MPAARGTGAAIASPRVNTEVMPAHFDEITSNIGRGAHFCPYHGSRCIGCHKQARDGEKLNANPAAVAGAIAQPDRENLAIYAGQLGLESGLRNLRHDDKRDPRSLDQPHRNPGHHKLNRDEGMGTRASMRIAIGLNPDQ